MENRIRGLLVFGTRPEAIKLAPVIDEFIFKNIEIKVCNTGQHKELVDQVIDIFNLKVHYNLAIMKEGQELPQLTSRLVDKLSLVMMEVRPNFMIIQGDTTTAMVAALIGFYNKCPVFHVEAGLRTYNIHSPYPEEINRRIISTIAEKNFAPTESSKINLLSEGVEHHKIVVTGNTVIDSILLMVKSINANKISYPEKLSRINEYKKIILVTTHRRENFDDTIKNICDALVFLANKFTDLVFILPVHPNPKVYNYINSNLINIPNILVVEPLNYGQFLAIMKESYLVLTDSGGVQEEAATLGVPLVIVRDTTERMEAVISGNSILAGKSYQNILLSVQNILENEDVHRKMSVISNCFGLPGASKIIVDSIVNSI